MQSTGSGILADTQGVAQLSSWPLWPEREGAGQNAGMPRYPPSGAPCHSMS